MSPDRSETLERIIGVMTRTFPNVQAAGVTPRTVSSDVAGWDSLSHSLLIMGVEEEFGLELPAEEIYEVASVGALVDLVERSRATKVS
jgi:acyl carrier protein